MTILLNQSFPTEMLDTLLKVTEKIGVRDDPPEGLIVHTIVQRAEGLQVVDVWDSKEQYDSFLVNAAHAGVRKGGGGAGKGPAGITGAA